MISFWEVCVMLLGIIISILLIIGEVYLLLYLIDIGHILSYIAAGTIAFITLAFVIWLIINDIDI
ncbi:hypothetical protein AIDNDMCJ_19160 (plasmid) [Bacillus safensis]|uniref:Uncharacterized protein n=1 Tax=Bacillus pumilus TaxID=1408 RepID=A0A9Q9PCM8_BACPU|nr:hypothetical protein SBRMV_045 [Bacillus pumilus]VCT99237.1 hypothetical protein AIDNDMCJ_19160 [Bacillus safensis]